MHELSITRLFDAPIDAVWRAWTEHLDEWFCPRPWRAKLIEQELKASGRSVIVMHGPAGEKNRLEGVILEVAAAADRHHRRADRRLATAGAVHGPDRRLLRRGGPHPLDGHSAPLDRRGKGPARSDGVRGGMGHRRGSVGSGGEAVGGIASPSCRP